MSVLGLIGQADRTVSTVRDVLEPLGVSESTLGTIENTLTEVSQVEGAGLLLILGLLGALWTASGYVAAFGARDEPHL
jgi:membrane protein